MPKLLKWAAQAAAATAVALAVVGVTVYWASESRLTRTFDVRPDRLNAAADAALVERGRHIATIRGCIACHAANLGGRVIIDNPMIGRFAGSNLTSGKGGIGARYADEDWVRAIRHGVRANGKPLLLMPANEFFDLSDADVAAVIAYARSMPPVDNVPPASAVSPIGRFIMTFDKDVSLLAAERIDHAALRPVAPPVGVTAEYGRYLATSCVNCHGDGFSGGPIPGAPPSWPAAANLTPIPGAAIARWSASEFAATLRTGVTPEGRQLDSRYMPWKFLGQMTNTELEALWLYLRGLSPRPNGSR
jgi:mono/diheme cytochrome c family protein